jgi:hypothetical protein
MRPYRFALTHRTARCTATVILLSLLLIWGCASGPHGGLAYDREVTRMFSGNSVPADYRYYNTGRSGMPYAIIGIDPQYQLITRWWDPVTPNTTEFKKLVDFIWKPDIWYRIEPAQGAWILSPAGEKIGVWYSMYPSTAITVKEGHQVDIYSPYPEGRE